MSETVETLEIDLQWLRAHLFRSLLEKDPTDHSDSENPWQWFSDRLPHPKFLSASLVWEIQRNPEKELLGLENLELKGYCKNTGILFDLDADDTKKAKTVYGEICAAVGLRHSPMVYQMVWVGESWGGTGTLFLRRPLQSQINASNTAQSSISFTDPIIWAAHQEADANFCSHPTAVRLKAFHEKGVHLLFPAGVSSDGVACLHDLSSFLLAYAPHCSPCWPCYRILEAFVGNGAHGGGRI